MVELSEYIPDFGLGEAGAVVSVIAWFIVIVIVAMAVGAGTYLIVRRWKFNKKIVIFEKIGRNFEPVRQDRAMVFKVGDAGDTVFYCRKHKKYLPTPSIQIGRGVYWYFIRSDDEWINFGLQDLDELSREVGARFLDKEMRYARTSLQKLMKKRYEEIGFWGKYGGVIAYSSLIAITGVMVYLLFDKYIEIAGEIARLLEVAVDVQKGTTEVLAALDNVCSGTGIRSA